MKLLEIELENFKNENITLKAGSKLQLKLIKLFSKNEEKNIKKTQNNNTK